MSAQSSPTVCGLCRAALDHDPVECPDCGAGYHAACLHELGRACATLGCAQELGEPPTRERYQPTPEFVPYSQPQPHFSQADYRSAPAKPQREADVDTGTAPSLGRGPRLRRALSAGWLLVAIGVASCLLIGSLRGHTAVFALGGLAPLLVGAGLVAVALRGLQRSGDL